MGDYGQTWADQLAHFESVDYSNRSSSYPRLGISEIEIKNLLDHYGHFFKISKSKSFLKYSHSQSVIFPSIQMGLETAFLSLTSKDSYCLFPSKFTKSKDTLPINGLIWMGDHAFMLKQLEQKLAAGFDCIKMKVGALDFDQEIALLKTIRERFSKDEIVLRVDANGAFSPEEAPSKLDALAAFDIHSIEQPLKAGQWEAMATLCNNTPIPIA